MTLELAKTKRILEILVDKGVMKPEQQQWVVDGIKNGAVNGKHSGEFAVGAGLITVEVLHETLREQATQKALAAAKDIKTIVTSGTQEIPSWLKVNIGNGFVTTPAAVKATPIEGAAAAANIAQNIVVMANHAPKMAKELTKSVEAASALATYLAGGGDKLMEIPTEVLQQWQADASDGLRKITQHIEKNTPSSTQVESYLAEREKEISSALGMNQWQDMLKNRAQQQGGSDLPSH